ncbi:chemotaxis protein CheW [Paenibacillus antri]|uniref:Chemotaxis protein CheW n=1 Tax=Paenibacillus antri TaxID=2582848 RepID=A0A5R9G0I6_9BACL|nr:chemotaxis protein CheW [Paenibacillus antri]TLS49827.1 chemotaxis protein CheW [Paenibacillus antri]
MAADTKTIVFSIGTEEYGIEVEHVKTIERMMPMTRVPKTPPFVKGVVNLRGVVVPVIHLASRFGLPENEPTENSRIVMVSVGDLEVGFIVDSANDVIDVNADRIEEPPEVVGGIRAKYLRGIAKVGENRLLVMLNLSEVLNKSEIIQLEQMED